jgi:hypothetical protein
MLIDVEAEAEAAAVIAHSIATRPATEEQAKYNSDVFRVKKLPYRSTEQLLAKAKELL